MSLFDLNAPENRETIISAEEMRSIKAVFPDSQIPILCAFRSDVRYMKQTHPGGACALSNHFIALFEQDQPGSEFRCFAMVHISQVVLIMYSTEKFVFVQTKDSKIILTAPDSLKLAQRLYVNCIFSYGLVNPEKRVQVRADDMRLFPEIDFEKWKIPVSYSQKFQFAYYANCTGNNVPYNHEVVRYVHTMMRSANSILDISQLPLDFASEQESNDLLALFSSLEFLEFTCGICCRDISRPDIFRSLAPLVANDNYVKIVHLENCNASENLEELADAVKFNPGLQIAYWNVSKNKLTECFGSFLKILTYSKGPLLYLNVSNCGIKPEDFAELFLVLARNVNMANIKHLYVGGINMTRIDTFERFIAKAEGIETFDISNAGPIAVDLIRVLVEKKYPLKHLSVRKSKLTEKAIQQLLIFIKESTTLVSLDMSYIGLTAEGIGGLVNAISLNEKLTNFELKLDGTGVTGAGLFPIFRAFLRSDLGKWRSLSFNHNKMTEDDLRNLTPLLIRMPNLECLSLSGNFDSEMPNVGRYLPDLMKIPSLNSLTITGGKSTKLRGQLNNLLKVIIREDKLKYLDVSKNGSGDQCLSSFIKIIHSCQKMESLNVDGSEFVTVDQLASLVEALDTNTTMTSFTYPVLDSQLIVKNAESDVKAVMKVLGELEIAAVNAINKNRIKRKMPNDLPFPATPEITALVEQISHETRRKIRTMLPKTHTCFCEDLQLPLPFQRMGDLVLDGGKEKIVDIGELEVYGIESMKRAIVEDKITYQTCICPTMYLTQMLAEAKDERNRKTRKHSHGKHDDNDRNDSHKSRKHSSDQQSREGQRSSGRKRRLSSSDEYKAKGKKHVSSDEEYKAKGKKHVSSDDEYVPKRRNIKLSDDDDYSPKPKGRRFSDEDNTRQSRKLRYKEDSDSSPKWRNRRESDDDTYVAKRKKRLPSDDDYDTKPKKKADYEQDNAYNKRPLKRSRRYSYDSDDEPKYQPKKSNKQDTYQKSQRRGASSKRRTYDQSTSSSDESPRRSPIRQLETRDLPSGPVDKLMDTTYQTISPQKLPKKSTRTVTNYDAQPRRPRRRDGPTVTFDFD